MLEVYRQYWRINLLTTLEYRANFLLWLGFTCVYHGSAMAALWIMLNNFPVDERLGLPQHGVPLCALDVGARHQHDVLLDHR